MRMVSHSVFLFAKHVDGIFYYLEYELYYEYMKSIFEYLLPGGSVLAACIVPQGGSTGTLAVTAASSPATGPPNIVCVVCEDIGPWLRCFGDSVAVTPTIDALAAEGVRYTGLYGTVGVSAPSRAALITGMYPTHINANYMRTQGGQVARPPAVGGYDVVLPEGVKCYTELLRAAGYYCTNNPKTDYQFLPPLTAWDECNRQAHWRNRPAGMPFFAIFNTLASHEQKVWESAMDTLYVSPDEVVLPPYYPDDSIVRRDIAIMYSNIYRVDCFVRQIMDELKESGEWDNTILIFYSDNGGPLPRQKREITEVGTHIPFIIRYPDGQLAGSVDEGLHSIIDIPPTILSLAGIKPPSYMDGKAFAGRHAEPSRRYVFAARDRMDKCYDQQGAVRDIRYRYICNYTPNQPGYQPVGFRLKMLMMRRMLQLHEEGRLDVSQESWFVWPRPREEFYDLAKDPHEMCNLIDDPACRKEVERLRKIYRRWEKRYWQCRPLTELEMIRTMWPDGVQPLVAAPRIVLKRGWVSLECTTSGVSYAYQINGRGRNGEKHWNLYVEPFAVRKGDKVTVQAFRVGYKKSETTNLLVEY